MNKSELTKLSISELTFYLRDRSVTSEQLVNACLERIEALQDKTNAFVCWAIDSVLEQARDADKIYEYGQINGLLHGIPIALKDNYWTYDFPTTGCSKINHGVSKFQDATIVARLRREGAIIIGKTNMHEWAYGATNEVSANGPTLNPWNSNHITGGSSGGSAAALSARMVPGALGSDTGGSVRIPSAACGVCAIKPTYGRVSRHGILPLSWSMDVPGVMTRSAKDLSILMHVIEGVDEKDLTTKNYQTKNYYANTQNSVGNDMGKSLKFAVPEGEGFEWAEDVDKKFREALKVFKADGANVKTVSINNMALGFAAWKVILHAEASAYHADFMAVSPKNYSVSVRTQLEAGRLIYAVDYLKAQQFRSAMLREFDCLLADFHALVLPTLPVTAPKIGQSMVSFGKKTTSQDAKKTTSQDAMTYLTWLANFLGLPAVSIPCGFGYDDMPVGLMLIGLPGSDFQLLKIAELFQFSTNWHLQSPDL